MRPCGSPPRNNSVPSWPATGKGSTTGSAPTPAVAGPAPPRATRYGAIRVLLTATSDATRLSALARDLRRHAFLLRATGSDYAALTEIRAAQGLIAEQNMPDLQALVELAVYRHAISIRNQSIPAGLPAVWAQLGSFRACRGPGPHHHQPRRPGAGARRAGQCGRPGRATRTAPRPWPAPSPTPTSRRRRSPSWPVQPPRPATRTAHTGWPPTPRPWPAPSPTLTPGAGARRAGPRSRRGRRPGPRARLAAEAEALARAITDPYLQAQALAELASAAAQAGDPDRAYRLAADAEARPAPSPTPTARRGR